MQKSIKALLTWVLLIYLNNVKAQALMNSNEDSPNINFVNGACFDFGATNTQKTSYVGLVNVMIEPNDINQRGLNSTRWFDRNISSRFGLNAGLMKINYAVLGDTLAGNHNMREQVLINPLDSIAPNKPYLLQYNKYSYTYKNLTFSIYAQPLIQINSLENARAQVYINAHYEALINRWTVNQTVTNFQQDTVYFSNNIPKEVQTLNQFGDNTKIPINVTSTYASIIQYIGGGFTFALKPWDESALFIQATFGRSFSSGPMLSVDNLSSPTPYDGYINFYLTRFTLSQHINSRVTIILGGELRGHSYPKKQSIPLPKPNYAVYIGLNVNLSSLFADNK